MAGQSDIRERDNLSSALLERPLIIAGPCAVESEEQITHLSRVLAEEGVSFLRGGAFKPRTDPASFQGLGLEGVRYLRAAADAHNQYVVSEVLETEGLTAVYDLIDIIQVGSRNMTSYGLLKTIGRWTAKDHKPVLLKRGMSSTIHEMLLAAQYVTQAGNPNVLLCLRGIRTFEQAESQFRYTPDLASILELKAQSSLTVIFDPSHAAGTREYVLPLARAALTLGADGLMIEVHDRPSDAFIDGRQSITPVMLSKFMKTYFHRGENKM